ncbi:MAG: PH domain-containing protein [Crocinitomicaceae bacterium]|nr:PH domain-containing protein [Crocinitomicaceae bacterium]
MNFCFNCGHGLNGGENFCPNCGISLKSDNKGREEIENDNTASTESLTFSSNILLGGSLLRPDRVTITSTHFIYEKRNKNLIGTDKVSIPINRISSVKLDRKLIDAALTIYSTGNKEVIVNDFSISNARKIKAAIEERMQ